MTKRPHNFVDLVGQRFGRLTVVEALPSKTDRYGNNRRSQWRCVCDCGGERITVTSPLKDGRTRSCGCAMRKHGHLKRIGKRVIASPTYSSWIGARDRCNNPNNPAYDNYGGLGIRMCDRWNSFESFLEDMGERPDGMSLDRIDNKKGYEPGNCKWSTLEEQANNKRGLIKFEYEGKMYTRTQLARIAGLNPQTIKNRLRRGMTIKEAVETRRLK